MGNRPVVYDKAKYHYDGDYPDDLPIEQAFVHTGMFLGWIIDHDLYSDEFSKDSAQEIRAFKGRDMSGPQVYASWDGCLIDDMLNEEGNRFATAYFDFDHGDYLTDYEEILAADLPSTYHVQDTWENYETLKRKIDERYRQWRGSSA